MLRALRFITILAVASAPAFGGLARTSVTNLTLSVHGIYLSADPLCKTGFVASVPLSATATAVNFASASPPTLGTGASLPASINCVVIILEDSVVNTWAAGTYTSTSLNNSISNSDSVCNAGGTVNQKICRSQALAYPDKITTDAAAAGVTLTTTCPSSPVGTELIPLYLSTNAGCSGATTDPASCGSNNAFAAPTKATDYANGIKLTAPATTGSSFTFVSDPDGVVVGATNSTTCGSLGPPLFSFKAN